MIRDGNFMSSNFDPRCHIGETHGIYTIVDMLEEKDKYGHWIYKCVCNECGKETLSHYGGVSGPKHITTTCRHIRANGEYIPYGHIWSNKRIANIFQKMTSRCYNKSDKDYAWYGAKDIHIFKEWLDNPIAFEKWAIHNGYNDELTIDRIDSNKDYCPENCQWISNKENSRKAGKVNWITVGEQTLTGHQWADKLGIGTNIINTAMRNYGEEKTKDLIMAMIKSPPSNQKRAQNQSWFSVYDIAVP